jgi:phosphoesterase RecJ-like protein
MQTANLKEAAPLIWAEIEKAKSILLHCHFNPDQDSIGSALAMMNVLESLGKKVTVIKGDSDLPAFTKHLPGADKIVLKNYFEVDLNDFDLFISQDSSDLERISKVGEIIFPTHLRVVNIDHHASNTNFGHVNLVATTKPATAQILFELFREWGINISPEAAGCLMVGLHSDTGGFKHRGTNEQTFLAAAELARIYPNFDVLLKNVYGNGTLGKLKFMGLIMSRVEILFDGKVALAGMSNEELTKLDINKTEIKQTGLSGMILEVEGVEMSFLLIEYDPGSTGISARSRNADTYDVAALLAPLGGGGHKVAAGVYIPKPLAEAKADLLAALTTLLQ